MKFSAFISVAVQKNISEKNYFISSSKP